MELKDKNKNSIMYYYRIIGNGTKDKKLLTYLSANEQKQVEKNHPEQIINVLIDDNISDMERIPPAINDTFLKRPIPPMSDAELALKIATRVCFIYNMEKQYKFVLAMGKYLDTLDRKNLKPKTVIVPRLCYEKDFCVTFNEQLIHASINDNSLICKLTFDDMMALMSNNMSYDLSVNEYYNDDLIFSIDCIIKPIGCECLDALSSVVCKGMLSRENLGVDYSELSNFFHFVKTNGIDGIKQSAIGLTFHMCPDNNEFYAIVLHIFYPDDKMTMLKHVHGAIYNLPGHILLDFHNIHCFLLTEQVVDMQ